MKNKDRFVKICYLMVSIAFYVSAMLNFFKNDDVSMGVVFLCLGSTFLCLGALYGKKEKSKDDEDNKNNG